MRTKEGVTLAGLHPVMRKALMAAERVWARYGPHLVVTSTTDGEHSVWSYHQFGCAVDLRTRYFPPGVVPIIAWELRTELEAIHPAFQVVVEATHIHVEYDWDEAERMNS